MHQFNWCGSIKTNTDGARNTSSEMFTCGRVGVLDLQRPLGFCSILEAEFWVIYQGLATAWSMTFPQVVVETDVMEAYEASVHDNPQRIDSSIPPYIIDIMN
ncbi:hypothetical protein V6N11_046454 [Hibiscus sabdariffa]|uniref:Uncharacterized protein n=2 Tax=Hibiscus sabdariffa TaxID=183260 RepID=A0ABR2BW11_9ROSI